MPRPLDVESWPYIMAPSLIEFDAMQLLLWGCLKKIEYCELRTTNSEQKTKSTEAAARFNEDTLKVHKNIANCLFWELEDVRGQFVPLLNTKILNNSAVTFHLP